MGITGERANGRPLYPFTRYTNKKHLNKMDIDVKELKAKMDRGDSFVLLDVREPYENAEFNVGGLLIPMGEFPAAAEQLEDRKAEEVVVYCRSGKRSATVQYMLQQAGFSNVRNLEGGMLAWLETFGQ